MPGRVLPSKENPVVIEGVWGDQEPERALRIVGRHILVVAPELHIRRLLEVNFRRQGYQVSSVACLADIESSQPEPGLLLFDCDHFDDESVSALLSSRGWNRAPISFGHRPSIYARASMDQVPVRLPPNASKVLSLIIMITFLGCLVWASNNIYRANLGTLLAFSCPAGIIFAALILWLYSKAPQ